MSHIQPCFYKTVREIASENWIFACQCLARDAGGRSRTCLYTRGSGAGHRAVRRGILTLHTSYWCLLRARADMGGEVYGVRVTRRVVMERVGNSILRQ